MTNDCARFTRLRRVDVARRFVRAADETMYRWPLSELATKSLERGAEAIGPQGGSRSTSFSSARRHSWRGSTRVAVAIVDEADVPGRSYFISHAMREIANRLPFALAGTKRARVEYNQVVDPIAKGWRKEELPSPGRSKTALSGGAEPDAVAVRAVEVSRPLAMTIGDLVDQHEAARARKTMIKEALSVAVAAPVAEYAFKPWLEVTEDAVKFAHVPDEDRGEAEFSSVGQRFADFEDAIAVLSANVVETMADLDEMSKDANERTS